MNGLLRRLGQLLREVAAQEIVPRFGQLAPDDVVQKPCPGDPTDVVTVADRAVETVLARVLPPLVPGSCVVGEEAVASYPGLLGLLRGPAPVWLVDPIDGTRNFAAGHGPFGTMVALVEGGVKLVSGIYSSEDDCLVLAEKGVGAFLNDEPLRAKPGEPDVLLGTVLDKFMPADLSTALRKRTRRHRPVPNAMCAAHEYVEIARGNKDYVVYYRFLPWDHAPGALIVGEAGGVARHSDGREYEVFDTEGPLLLAPCLAAWERAHRELFA